MRVMVPWMLGVVAGPTRDITLRLHVGHMLLELFVAIPGVFPTALSPKPVATWLSFVEGCTMALGRLS